MSAGKADWDSPAAVGDAMRSFRVDDPDLAEHAPEMFDAFRTHCPVGRSEEHGGFWLLTRYRDVREAYLHPDVFSSRYVGLDWDVGEERPLIPLQIDPPQHLEYRRVLNPFFTSAEVRKYGPQIRSVVRGLIDRFAAAGRCEFIADFAYPLPSDAFVHFVGWPPEDADLFHDWAYKTLHGVAAADRGRIDPSVEVQHRAGEELAAYFRGMTAERRRQPADDLLSRLLDVRLEDNRTLTDDELVDIMYLLVIAGFDTTRKMLGLMIRYLATHERQRDQLSSDLSLTPTAVDELMRWEAPLLMTRTLTRDYVIGGEQLKRGSKVLLSSGGAGRDPEAVTSAEEVRLDRRRNAHLTFGAGAHRCLGIHFARLELEIALEEFHRRIPDYRVDPAGTVELSGGFGRGVDRLPLLFTPSPPEPTPSQELTR